MLQGILDLAAKFAISDYNMSLPLVMRSIGIAHLFKRIVKFRVITAL